MARWFARHVIGFIQSWRGNNSHVFFVLDLSTLLTNYKFTVDGFLKIESLKVRECSRVQCISKRRSVLRNSCLKPVWATRVVVWVVTWLSLPPLRSNERGRRRSRTCLREMCWIKKRGWRQEENQDFFQQWGIRHILLFLFIFNSLNLDRGIC